MKLKGSRKRKKKIDVEKKIAKYECLECNYKYEGNCGPQPDCPKCGSLYFKWLNYEKFALNGV